MATTIAFLQKLPESAELLSGIAGTKTVKEYTKQVGVFIAKYPKPDVRIVKVEEPGRYRFEEEKGFRDTLQKMKALPAGAVRKPLDLQHGAPIEKVATAETKQIKVQGTSDDGNNDMF